MKRHNLLIAVIASFVLLTSSVHAQTTPNYFIGKWAVLLKGTPNGDGYLHLIVVDSAGIVKGSYLDTATKKQVPFTKVEQADHGKITFYFNISNYDVYLKLEKKDDNHATGTLLDMFDAVAEREKK